jgi:hypothetical protein
MYEQIAFGIYVLASYVLASYGLVGYYAFRLLPTHQPNPPVPLASKLMLTAFAPLFMAMALACGTFVAIFLAAFYFLDKAHQRLTGRDVLYDEAVQLPERPDIH